MRGRQGRSPWAWHRRPRHRRASRATWPGHGPRGTPQGQRAPQTNAHTHRAEPSRWRQRAQWQKPPAYLSRRATRGSRYATAERGSWPGARTVPSPPSRRPRRGPALASQKVTARAKARGYGCKHSGPPEKLAFRRTAVTARLAPPRAALPFPAQRVVRRRNRGNRDGRGAPPSSRRNGGLCG